MSSSGFLENDPSFSTRAIHVGQEPEQWNSLAVVPPISMSTTFKQDAPAEHRGFKYGRSTNPTRLCLERCLASLEQAKYGLTFASGMAATQSIINMLKVGDHFITMDDLYGGTNRFFRKVASKFGLIIDFVDATDLENVRKAVKENTKMIWIETPTNPTLKVVDIRGVSEIAKSLPDCFTVVDNTFLSPYFQRPLTLGADMVLHSCTKYLNGHSDVLMGAVCTNSDVLEEKLRFLQNAIGSVPSPFDCYLVNRSLKTLALRMKKHWENGLAVAKFLENNPYVEKVLHPGLPSHPQHELAKKQSYGHSGMITFYIKGNNLEVARNFFKHIKMFTLAESLGGFDSLAQLPSLMSHASVSPEERARLNITDGLIRLSCGLEDSEDLINDVDQALKAAFTS
ncbi:Cystathionine gamma-lyase [Armadillidium nasatum]|uniref:cystathionine gamma-lyase n=1 Tax=Armadillidium nasatum TaxID=96803 RepID=A0A5N5TDX3_9CRUS|nr:Cystathionine gamma-lyase [Armadillidium nasatum]